MLVDENWWRIHHPPYLATFDGGFDDSYNIQQPNATTKYVVVSASTAPEQPTTH